MAVPPGRRDAAPFGSPAFRDRTEAGVALGAVLRDLLGYGFPEDPERERTEAWTVAMTSRLPGRPRVLALPRGGVPVAVGVARALGGALDVLVVRKIGHPDAPELGLGAIAEDGAGGAAEPFFDQQMLDEVHLTRADLASVVARERAELARRAAVYGRGRAAAGAVAGADLAGQFVVVVDDGLATGVTARAALRSVRARGADRILLAVPVGSPAAVAAVSGDTVRNEPGRNGPGHNETGEVVTVVTPRRFRSVGEWYADFGQLTDADVLALLPPGDSAPGSRSGGPGGVPPDRHCGLTGS
jgi:putative phosphoribosyl transferase